MIQRWALHLSGYSYEISHRPGKQIANADFLSRYAFLEEPEIRDEEVLLATPLPITRNYLIEETRNFYGPVLAALRRGWSNTARKRFPELYSRRSELQLYGDDVIGFGDRPLIPPTCRSRILEHLHSGHMGRDKMVSLARMIAW